MLALVLYKWVVLQEVLWCAIHALITFHLNRNATQNQPVLLLRRDSNETNFESRCFRMHLIPKTQGAQPIAIFSYPCTFNAELFVLPT